LFIVGILIYVPFKIELFGCKMINLQTTDPKETGQWKKGFTKSGWDGPTGTYSSGEIYIYNRGTWMWRLDIIDSGIPEPGL
jgi:hypothetical protein